MTTADAWILTDTDRGLHTETFAVHGTVPDSSRPWHVRAYVLRGGRCDGVNVVEIDSGRLHVWILPTRGMGIWRGECDGMPLGWTSPVAHGPVHPGFVQLADAGGTGWLAGFDEWIVRCGLEWIGPPDGARTLHGRIANLPAHRVWVEYVPGDPPELVVHGEVDEARLAGPRLRLAAAVRLPLGLPRLVIDDRITNLGATPATAQLLYHCNFGPPLLEEGSRVVAPVRAVVPRDACAGAGISTCMTFPAPTAGAAESCYWLDLLGDDAHPARVLLRNRDGSRGASLTFDLKQLPCFTLWKFPAALADGYVTGLEPGTSLPNPASFEAQHGRTLALAPGADHRSCLTVEIHSTPAQVQTVEAALAERQSQVTPRFHPRPLAGWSPAGA